MGPQKTSGSAGEAFCKNESARPAAILGVDTKNRPKSSLFVFPRARWPVRAAKRAPRRVPVRPPCSRDSENGRPEGTPKRSTTRENFFVREFNDFSPPCSHDTENGRDFARKKNAKSTPAPGVFILRAKKKRRFSLLRWYGGLLAFWRYPQKRYSQSMLRF